MPLMRRVAALGAAVTAARRYARQNPEKVSRYADQAARFVDQRTHGRYRKQIDSAMRQVRKETGAPGHTQAFPGDSGRHGGTHQPPRDESTRQYPSYREDRPH